MNSVLFVPSVSASEWVPSIAPETSPATLPVAGRRYIDYALELAQKHDVVFSEIIDWHFSARLAEDFSDLARTGYPVFYHRGEGALPRGLADLETAKSPLVHAVADNLLVVWGLCLMTCTTDEISAEPVSDAECAETPTGVYRRVGGRWMRLRPNGIVIRDLKTWHSANFVVLGHPKTFTLPGYSAEKEVHIGRNVVLERGTEVRPPALLQDNVWCARNVQLEGDVIVGRDSFVSEGSRLRRTVVCDDTFIGEGLELTDKIVLGRRIIDVKTGAWVDVEEPGVAKSIPVGFGWLTALWNFLLGASRGRRRR